MGSKLSDDIKLCEKNFEMIKVRIIDKERSNLKTKYLSEKQMVEEIRKIIVEEANKNY